MATENAEGGNGNDTLTGDGGSNRLSGGLGGNDVLNGGNGDDTFLAWSGHDTFNEGQVGFIHQDGQTRVLINVAGVTAGVEMEVWLTGTIGLVAGDFVL